MLRKMKEKAGNEILQTLVIIAVIGALAITICVLVSNKLKNTGKNSLNTVGNSFDILKDFMFSHNLRILFFQNFLLEVDKLL